MVKRGEAASGNVMRGNRRRTLHLELVAVASERCRRAKSSEGSKEKSSHASRVRRSTFYAHLDSSRPFALYFDRAMAENGSPSQQDPQQEQHEQHEQEEPQAATGSPSDFLKQVVGEHVVVRLNSGVDYRGESLLRWLLCSGVLYVARYSAAS